MTISTANAQHVSKTTSGTSVTLTSYAVPSGTNNLLVVFVGQENSGSALTGITHNGVALTYRQAIANTGNSARIEMWDLPLGSTNPTGDIVASWSTSCGASWIIAQTLQDAAQSAPQVTATAQNAGSSFTQSITTTSADTLIVDGCTTNTGGGTIGLNSGLSSGVTLTDWLNDLSGGTIQGASARLLTTATGTFTLGYTNVYTRMAYISASYAVYSSGGGVTGTIAATWENFTSSINGTTTIVGTVAQTTANFTSAITGTSEVPGTLTATTEDDVGALEGTAGIQGTTGTITGLVDDSTASMTGTTTVVGASSTQIGDFLSAVTGTTTIVGTLTGTSDNMVSTINGYVGTAPTERRRTLVGIGE